MLAELNQKYLDPGVLVPAPVAELMGQADNGVGLSPLPGVSLWSNTGGELI